ncbi:MAG: efflux RND transporter periplasmic adaptor subunit [candidate division Zixibacteria bacterium]|nr:efflux RND transporter periplasmic adaptor subunit [candidate division Zixibacteria bacterium]
MRFLKLIWVSYLVLLLNISCSQKEETAEEIIRPVRYDYVFISGGTRVRTFSASTHAGMESKLSFRVSGTIKNINVKVGDKVRPGQLIASLDQADYKLQVQEAEASLTNARALSRQASANYDRIRQLYENRNASRNELDGSRAASESTIAQVKSAEKRLELAGLQLGYTKLSAPTNGAIAAVNAEVNENISAGHPIVIMTSGKKCEIHVAVPEMLISQIREGDNVTVTFDAIPNDTLGARVTEVGVTSMQTATTYPVTALLHQADDRILPGMAAEVSFKFKSKYKGDRYSVSPASVGEDRKGRFVFVVKPEEDGYGTVRRQDVIVGDLHEDGIEILGGLTDGDRIVTAGISKIKDGQKVKLTHSQEMMP